MAAPAIEAALTQMVGSGLTCAPVDNAKAVLVIRAAEASGDRQLGVRLVVAARRAHRDWLAVTQRRWQRHTRRPSRAAHHDSVTIRERYVRCN